MICIDHPTIRIRGETAPVGTSGMCVNLDHASSLGRVTRRVGKLFGISPKCPSHGLLTPNPSPRGRGLGVRGLRVAPTVPSKAPAGATENNPASSTLGSLPKLPFQAPDGATVCLPLREPVGCGLLSFFKAPRGGDRQWVSSWDRTGPGAFHRDRGGAGRTPLEYGAASPRASGRPARGRPGPDSET
jgi:hypothetical protein